MEFQQKESLETRQGNLSGLVYVRGRNAFTDGASIFDCPFEAGSDKAELWMNGFQYEENKSNGRA